MASFYVTTTTKSGQSYDLYLESWGDEHTQKPPLFCMHGLTGSTEDFAYLGRYMAQHSSRRVIAIDMPGRGRSAWFDDPQDYCFAQYLKDIHAAFDSVGISAQSPCDWLGVSMGGLLGFHMAAGSARIRKLILSDIGPDVPQADLDFIAMVIKMNVAYARIEDAVPVMKRFLGTAYSRGAMNEEMWTHFAKTSLKLDPATGKYVRNFDPKIVEVFETHPLGSENLWHCWDRITQPALALRGALSSLFPLKTLEEMQRRKTGAPMDAVTFDDCGHVPSLYPDHQIKPIAEWLDRQLFQRAGLHAPS